MRGALVAFVVLLNAGCEVKELADTLPPPTSLDFDLTPATVPVRNFLDLRVSQKNLDPSQFTWAADLGTFVPLGDEGTSIRWLAPLMPGTATISLSTSEDPELDTSVTIEVVVQPGPDAIDPVLRPDGQRTEHVVWSPDGTRFATSAGDSVRVWDAQTAAPLAGFSVDAAAGLSWSTADGTLVAQSPSGHVVRWDPADPTWQQRFEAGEEASDLAFDPGGHRLALSRIAGTQLLDANTYEPLATEPSLGGHLSWTADGFKLLVGGRLWDPVVDLASGQAGLRDPTAVHPDGLLVAGTALVAPFEAVVHDGVSGDRIAVRASAPRAVD